jgi:thymidylate synthase (FAD)
MHWETVHEYLTEIGGVEWYHRTRQDASSDTEALIEFAGRLCYRSWEPGLNANVRQVRTNREAYFDNILASGHGSVLEHANFTFVFQDVSRVFTHELVRHRAGVAISQESLRYVRLTDLGFRIPKILADGPSVKYAPDDESVGIEFTMPMENAVIHLVETLERFQVQAAEAFGLDDDGTPFHYKKEVTSALRRLAPIGLSTTILWTANVRTLRHVINMRTAPGAEEEMRIVFANVAGQLAEAFPLVFGDFEQVEVEGSVPHWKPRYEKV